MIIFLLILQKYFRALCKLLNLFPTVILTILILPRSDYKFPNICWAFENNGIFYSSPEDLMRDPLGPEMFAHEVLLDSQGSK